MASVSCSSSRCCCRSCSSFGGQRDNSFRFGFGLFFLEFLLFRFGGSFAHFALLFAFDGVVHRAGGVIGGSETSLFRFSLRFFFLRFGDVFG